MEAVIALFGPQHPPLVHFAVACPILALFALVNQRVWNKPWLSYSAAALWVFGFLAACAAVVTGHLFSLHLGMVSQWSILPPESAEKGRLRDHALWGTIAFLSSFATLWAAWRTFREKPLSFPWQFFIGLIAAVLFGVTGHEGGEMVYGSESEKPVEAASSLPQAPNPLELAKDYRQNLVKMNSKTWNSKTHGHRWVNTYVSKEAVEAYKNINPLPEGSLVVKESFKNVGGQSSQTPGPLYVMWKGKLADSASTGGWQYAMRWEKPVPGNPENIQRPVTWLPGDGHLNSCVKCHNHFKAVDYLGGIPDGYENP